MAIEFRIVPPAEEFPYESCRVVVNLNHACKSPHQPSFRDPSIQISRRDFPDASASDTYRLDMLEFLLRIVSTHKNPYALQHNPQTTNDG
jgi:hypothetical protein